MDRSASYDDDIYSWSQDQAAALRRLAATRRDLPNDLDLEHVAEEIEDLGKSEVRTVESFIELLLRHLVKIASAPDAPSTVHWAGEVVYQQRALRKDLKRSMHRLIDLDDLWGLAKLRADAALAEHGDKALVGLPIRCPFGFDDLGADTFDIDAMTARLKAASDGA